MPQSATVKSVRQAARIIKSLMNHVPEGWESPNEAGRTAIRKLLEEQMQVRRRAYLEAELSQGKQDRMNGFYRRHLLTALGDIELSVPRTRSFSAVNVLRRYARREGKIDRAILACFVLGLSTRKVAEALLPILGERISPSTVSRVARSLDQAVADFHRRALRDNYCLLQFDGVVLSRRSGTRVQKRPVLVALGIRPDRRKEVIDFLIAPAESEPAWEGFLNDLYRRGLKGEGVEIITIDGCRGLANALLTVFPRARIQRCWAHKVRNVLDKVRKGDWDVVKRALRKIYQAKNRIRAIEAALRFGANWERSYPAAVRCLMRDLEELLACFYFSDPDWQRLVRTTNAIERRFREVRRRTRPMGVFSDRTSIERILYAVFSYENRNQATAVPFLLTQNS
jgi:transposase-like protein